MHKRQINEIKSIFKMVVNDNNFLQQKLIISCWLSELPWKVNLKISFCEWGRGIKISRSFELASIIGWGN